MKKPLLLLLFSCLFWMGFTAGKPVDFLGVPGPIRFDGKTFNLAWSANPNSHYFKHEYLPPNQTPEKYTDMLLLELVLGNFTPQDVAAAQMQQLEKRKATDKTVQYEAIENPETGEIILDFTLSSGPAKALEIMEWNAYRYKPYTDAKGRKGVLLFGISRRAYGNTINTFLTELKSNRTPYIHAIGGYPLPEVTVKE